MLIKLATQNIKRSQGFFLAYSLTIGVLFTIIYQLTNIEAQLSVQLGFESASMGELDLKSVFEFLKYFMYAVILFFTAYISRFFMKRRSKEIALLKTLGLNRKSIWSMFLIENLIIIISGVVIGLFLGVITSRLFSITAMSLLGFQAHDVGFSILLSGMSDVAIIMILVYIVMAIAPLKAISQSSIVQLMGDQVKVDVVTKKPYVSFFIFIISTIILVFYSIFIIPTTLTLPTIALYLLLGIIVAVTLYRGFALNYFYSFTKKGKGLGKPVRQLAFSHLGGSVKGLYKMMAFITIIAAVVTVIITTTFGYLDSVLTKADGFVKNPLMVVSDSQKATEKYANLMSENDINNKSYEILNSSDVQFKNDSDDNQYSYTTTSQNLLIIKASTFNDYAKFRGSKVVINKTTSNVNEKDCNLMQDYCNLLASENLNKVAYNDEVGRLLTAQLSSNYFNLYDPDTMQHTNELSNNFIDPTIIVLSDADYESLNKSDYTPYYVVSGDKLPQKNEFFKYNNMFLTDPVLNNNKVAVIDQTPITLMLSNVAIGLFQLILLLASIITSIALMMAIFFRTLENMEKGINEYVIAKQIGMSKKQILQATSLEAFISQLVPFAIGVIVSLFMFNQMFQVAFDENTTIFTILFQPSNIMILGGLFLMLIILVLILVFLINTRINDQKKMN
ncbi:FtsX-like permease family protein [Mycoplasma sp. P36-A1]|uniref:FtsX-like permease family protein n=1 Tax=Mycoplasma sp. P36-A1 TaxID=3252900 RepID=UPI003C2F76B5